MYCNVPEVMSDADFSVSKDSSTTAKSDLCTTFSFPKDNKDSAAVVAGSTASSVMTCAVCLSPNT